MPGDFRQKQITKERLIKVIKLDKRINMMADQAWISIVDQAVELKRAKDPEKYISRASYMGVVVLKQALKDIEMSTNRNVLGVEPYEQAK